MKPVGLLIVDSVLFVRNLHSNTLFSFYNVRNFRKMGDCFTYGAGPGEMLNPQIMHCDSSMLWITDSQKRKMYSYDIPSLLKGELKEIQEVTVNDYLSDVVCLDNGNFVGLAYAPGHNRMTLYDTNGDSIMTKGEFPSVDGSELSFLEIIEGYECAMAISREKKRILLSYKLMDLIEIYDTDGRLIRRNHGPDHFVPALKEFDYGNGLKQARPIAGQARDAYFCPVEV